MKDELKPCPFCGGNNIRDNYDDGRHFNSCKTCGATGPYTTKYSGEEDEPFVEWNTRYQIEISDQQLEILKHAVRTGQHFCGGSRDMDILCQLGLMEYAGRKSFVPDAYYKITERGKKAVRIAAANSKRHGG